MLTIYSKLILVAVMLGAYDSRVSQVDSDCPNPMTAWSVTPPEGRFEYEDVAVDSTARILTTGTFTGTVDFDPGPGVDLHTGNWGVFVTAFAGDGAYLWTQSLAAGADYAAPAGLVVDAQGGVVIAGGFFGTADFDPSDGVDLHSSVDNPATTSPDYNIFLTKLNADGGYAWTVTFGGGNGSSGASRIARDGFGNLLVVGGFSGEVDFDPGDGVELHRSTPVSYDIFVTKLDTAGHHIWTRTFGGTGADSGTGVAVDLQGNVFATGTFRGVADFDPGPGVDLHYQHGLIQDVFLTKLYADGSYAWTHTWPVFYPDSSYGRVAVDSEGSAIIAGAFDGTVDFDPTAGVDLRTSVAQLGSGFVTKIFADGSYAWTATFLTDPVTTWGQASGFGVAVGPGDTINVTGDFRGRTDFDPSDGVVERASNGNSDVFILRLSPAGELLWVRTLGNPSVQTGTFIAVGPDDAVCVAGYFSSPLDFDVGCAVDVHSSLTQGLIPFLTKLACVAPTADFDGSGVINLRDVAAFQNCFTGDPATVCPSGCEVLDFDRDDDIDLSDLAAFERLFAAP